MLDHEKTKEKLIEELQELRRSVRRLEYKSREDDCQSIENSSLILLKMLDRSNQAYLLLQDGKLEFLNQACVEMFGYSQGECSSLPHMLEKVIHPDDREMVNKYYSYRLRSDTANHRYACRIFCKDGSAKWLDIQSAGLVWNDKLTFLIVATDITRYMQIQSSLQETASTLEERVKEMNCLYQIANVVRKPGLSLPGILEKAVNFVREAWKDPEITCAMIRLGGDIYKTPNYAPCAGKQTEAIEVDGAAVGLIEVGYFEEKPENHEGSSLKGKRSLITAISEMVGETISSKRSFEELKILEKAIRTSINGIGLAHPDGTVFSVNEAFLRMWGYSSQQEVIEKHISEFLANPNTANELIELLKKGDFVLESTAQKSDGSKFEIQLSISSVKDDSGNMVCMMGAFLDITDRKLAEENLVREKEKLKNILDRINDGIYLVDSQYNMQYANPVLLSERGNMGGNKCHEYLAGLPEPCPWCRNDDVLAGETISWERKSSKTGKVYDIFQTPVKSEDGSISVLVMLHDITKHKKAERTIREREQQFREITDSAFDAIVMINNIGDIIVWNQAAELMFGYNSSEAIGKNVHELLAPPRFQPDAFSNFDQFRFSGTGNAVGKVIELAAVRKSGEEFPIELAVSSFQIDGRWHASAVARDLTERNKLYQALRSSEERFRQVSANAEEWIWEVDQDGMYTYSSSAVQKILGYSIDEVVGKKYFYDFFLPEEREKLKELAFSEFAEKRSFSQFINRNLRKDGAIVTIESSGVAIFDQQGEMIGYRGVDKDITEQVRAEAERLRLVTAIEQTAATVLITGVDGTIEYVNPAFERITGYTSGEVVGKNPRILQSGKHDRAFYLDLWKTISGGKVWTGRLINKTKDGALVYKDGSIAPVRGSDGNIVNYVQVTQDVTKIVELQNQLVQAQKLEAIGTLAGGIAHDFNNILFAITGFTELAMMDLPADSRARSNMERVMQAAK
ncbi:MAG: PAS domain S-box protein [Desulfomonilaceae bacterium]